MSTTIDQLEIEVQSNSTSAVSGIDALSESLRRLKAATAPVSKGGVGLGALSTSLKKFSDSVSKLTGLSLAKEQVQGLVDALKPLESVQKSGFNSLASGLDKLVKIAPQIDTVTESLKKTDLNSFADQCNRVTVAVTPLATQMEKVAAGFSAFPAKIQRLLKGNVNLSASNTTLSKSYVNLAAKISLAYMGMKKITSVIAGWITDSNSYIENMNLFNVSMGQYAGEAQKYAEQVGEVMGINSGEWMRNQGVFMTITEGFGVAGDRAYTMSKNLTQLTYDLSSFFNISTSDAFQKLESGISGELEPLRRLGYDLSVARLQQEAYNLGINKSVTAMTQAEKAELRYYAIMTQVTNAQGDMARTLDAPANQLRILKAQVEQATRALGNLFIPVLKAILPYAIALAKTIRMVADIIADFFNIKIPEFDTTANAVGGIASGTGDMSDNLGSATENAKQLKKSLLGIDEINALSSPNTGSNNNNGTTNIGGSGGLGFELPTYDFIKEAVNNQIDGIMGKVKPFLSWVKEHVAEILAGVTAIGAAFLSWKIAKGVSDFLEWMSTLKGFNLTGSISFKIAGIGTFLDAWNTMKEAVQDILENGPNFTNVTKLISGFAEGLGSAFLLFGNIKMAGAMFAISGLTGITSAISDMLKNGINWDNALSLVKNIGIFLSGIGLLSGKTSLAGVGLIISGATLIVDNLKGLLEAIKTGDWSSVNVVEIAAGALMIVSGFILTLNDLGKLKDSGDAAKAAKETIQSVTTTASDLSTSTGKLSSNLTSLAKNLGMGLVIIGEVAAAAALIVGSIALLGYELGLVADAWEPVLTNGDTVLTAVGLGSAILVSVGAVSYGLGSVGKSIALNIGIGTAILAELGIATGLFLVEIWGIGKGLDEIGKAWQPVLNNGETIAAGIGIGTGLLVAIGVVTAALGAATVGTAGLLPVAIGLGTAILVELAAAFILFNESLVDVADELSNRLAPSLSALNEKLPDLNTDMADFVDFMGIFAGEIVEYTGNNTVAGLAATIDTIVGWFTTDPIAKLSKDVEKISGQAADLNTKLNVAVPELRTATLLFSQYTTFMAKLGELAGQDGTVNLSEGLKTNLKEVGAGIVTGLAEGIRSKYSLVQDAVATLGQNTHKWFTGNSYGNVTDTAFSKYATNAVKGFRDSISEQKNSVKSIITTWATDIKNWFTSNSYGGINEKTFATYGAKAIMGFKNGISRNYLTAKSIMTAWASNVKNWFTSGSYGSANYNTFRTYAQNVINGFNNGINRFYTNSRPYMKKWASDIKNTFTKQLDEHSPSKKFYKFAKFAVLGFNKAISLEGLSTKNVIQKWAESFMSVPQLSEPFTVPSMDYRTVRSFSENSYYTASQNQRSSTDGFKAAMREVLSEFAGMSSGGNWTIQIVDENGEVKSSAIVTAAERKNRRDGKTVIPVGG